MGDTPNNPSLTPPDGKHPPASDARQQRLRKLKQSVADGTYKVDSDAVAEKIVRKHFFPDKDTERH